MTTQKQDKARKQARKDVFWVMDKITGKPKEVTESFLDEHFDVYFDTFGDNQDMYTKLMKKAGITFE